MAICRSCKSSNIVTESRTGDKICADCAIVQEFDNFQHQYGGVSGPEGTFIRLGTAGSGTDYSYKDRKLLESNSIIEDITFRLDFSGARTRDVKTMVEKVIDGEFGLGNWFTVLVGACCYIVMRQNNKSLPISEVVDVVECELYEMGKMVNRVVDFLELRLPEFDVVGLLENTIRRFSGFREVDEDTVDLMIKQGTFVIQCAVKWFLTTGRRPGPMAVAVSVFVATLNGVKVEIEVMAKDMNMAIKTCRLRYKELLEALVEVARGLPWGKDVNVKNVVKNASFIIRYMEMKLMESEETKKKFVDSSGGFDLVSNVKESLNKEIANGIGLGEYDNSPLGSSINDVGNLKISHEDLSKLYSKFKSDFANRGVLNVNGGCDYNDRLNNNLFFDEWWSGWSKLCKRLMLQQLSEQDIGFETLPPSYIRGCLAVDRRREKIKAAKVRISSIICPKRTQPSNNNGLSCSELNANPKKKRKRYDDVDWEDFIIETLLLHKVKEEEIEKGYYNALLGVHVFQSGVI